MQIATSRLLRNYVVQVPLIRPRRRFLHLLRKLRLFRLRRRRKLRRQGCLVQLPLLRHQGWLVQLQFRFATVWLVQLPAPSTKVFSNL